MELGLSVRHSKKSLQSALSVNAGNTSTGQLKIIVLQSSDLTKTRFLVENLGDDPLTQLQILTMDGRDVYSWIGADVLRQRDYEWDGSISVGSTSASGTYIIHAATSSGSHSVTIQRKQ